MTLTTAIASPGDHKLLGKYEYQVRAAFSDFPKGLKVPIAMKDFKLEIKSVCQSETITVPTIKNMTLEIKKNAAVSEQIFTAFTDKNNQFCGKQKLTLIQTKGSTRKTVLSLNAATNKLTTTFPVAATVDKYDHNLLGEYAFEIKSEWESFPSPLKKPAPVKSKEFTLKITSVCQTEKINAPTIKNMTLEIKKNAAVQ